jgi:hypothetical protein
LILSHIYLPLFSCTVSVLKFEERRYCFELHNTESGSQLYLQAETFPELQAWIWVIRASMPTALSSRRAVISKTLSEELTISSGSINQLYSNKPESPFGLQCDIPSTSDPNLITLSHKGSSTSDPLRNISFPNRALQKRNIELHRVLKSIPAEDCVVSDFSAALQKDILIQGLQFIII